MLAIVLVLVLVAVPLQMMGYTSTCTMGNDAPFATGAILSAPLLLAALAMLVKQALADGGNVRAGVVILTSALGLVCAMSAAWLNTIRFGTACGAGFQMPDEQFDLSHMLVVFSYLILPALIIAASGRSILAPRANAERFHL
jgi:hypothetical protein